MVDRGYQDREGCQWTEGIQNGEGCWWTEGTRIRRSVGG